MANTPSEHPTHACTHPNRHEFYNWRSLTAARVERDAMANNPHYARLYVSEIYRGTLGGWAWTVCWQCGPGADQNASGAEAIASRSLRV